MRDAIRRCFTTKSEVPGTWTRTGPTQIEDSYLALCRTEFNDNSLLYVTLEGWGEVHLSILYGEDDNKTFTYVRSLLAHFPKQDHWYRRFGAQDVYEVHRLLGPTPRISVRELARELRLSWFQMLDPCENGATVWYTAGNLLGGARLAVSLDSLRRYSGGGFG
jgi:hypothetical protein